MINSVCGIGSTGRICTDLYHELESKGHECCIVYGRGTCPKDIKTHKISSKMDVINHILITRVLDRHGFASKKSTFELVDFIEEYNPDLIHLHNLHGYYLNIEILWHYIRKKRIRVVWTFHDMWPFSPHGAYLKNYEIKQSDRNERYTDRFEYPKTYFFSQSKRNYSDKLKLFSNYDLLTIVVPSTWLYKIVKNSFFKNNKTIVVRNGINLSSFYCTNNLKTNNKKIILGVANFWEKRKGIDVFNELSKIITDDYQIVLVGDRKKNKKNKRITYIDNTKNIDELRNLYNMAYIFLNPTRADNYPTTNLEAQACNTAVITTDIGGAPETIYNGKGKVAKNLDEIITYIYTKDLWFNEKLEIPLEFLDKKSSSKQYINIYEDIINEYHQK